MRPRLLRRNELDPQAVAGGVLCHDVRDADHMVRVRKGRVLSADDAPALADLVWDELHLLILDSDDVHETPAGERLARAATGAGAVIGKESAGHWPVRSTHRGIVDVAVNELAAVNAIDGLCIYTLLSGHVVDAGETIARAKITPFAVAESQLRDAEAIAQSVAGLVRVRPFAPTVIGPVVQESLPPDAATRFENALGEKVHWLGSTLLRACFTPAREEMIADAIGAQLGAGARIIILAGTKALDPLDPGFRALSRLNATPIRHGVPAHPGSLFWMSDITGVPVLGMPTCGLFSEATVFDLVLPQILSGSPVGHAELARLGHGGLLTHEMTFRFPPYRRTQLRGEL